MESRHMKTARRHLTMLLVVGNFLAAGAHADQASRLERQQAPKEPKASVRTPQIGSGFSAKDAFALKLAYKGAMKRLQKDQSCRALFDNLNLGGLQALGQSRYRPVRSEAERAYCARGVHAYTAVGRDQIVICRHFHTLNQRTKEGVLIHEALHTAGMLESPHDPDGETPEEITEMVEKACSLSF